MTMNTGIAMKHPLNTDGYQLRYTLSKEGIADLEAASKKRREREKMQRYRQRLVEKHQTLKIQAFNLETELLHIHASRSVSSSVLPWIEVLHAMRDDVERLTKSNHTMKVKYEAYQKLIHGMQAWMDHTQWKTNSMSSQVIPTRTPWRYVTLDVNPATRKLGFDWITKGLFHNHDRVFQQCHFPPPDSPNGIADFVVDTTNGYEDLQYLWRIQVQVPVSLDVVRDKFARPHLLHHVTGRHLGSAQGASNLSDVMAADETLLQDFGGLCAYVHSHWAPHVLVNFLTREFSVNETGRYVFVAQSVHDDPLLPVMDMTRNRMIWIVLDPISPGITTIRMLCVHSRTFSKDGPVSDDEEIKRWRGNMTHLADDVEKERMLIQHVTSEAVGNIGSFHQELKTKLNLNVVGGPFN